MTCSATLIAIHPSLRVHAFHSPRSASSSISIVPERTLGGVPRGEASRLRPGGSRRGRRMSEPTIRGSRDGTTASRGAPPGVGVTQPLLRRRYRRRHPRSDASRTPEDYRGGVVMSTEDTERVSSQRPSWWRGWQVDLAITLAVALVQILGTHGAAQGQPEREPLRSEEHTSELQSRGQ